MVTPSFGSAAIQRQLETLAIESILALSGYSRRQATRPAKLSFPPDLTVYLANDSGSRPISPKSSKTVLPELSTPKLLTCMSDWVKIKGSFMRLIGCSCFAGNLERSW